MAARSAALRCSAALLASAATEDEEEAEPGEALEPNSPRATCRGGAAEVRGVGRGLRQGSGSEVQGAGWVGIRA